MIKVPGTSSGLSGIVHLRIGYQQVWAPVNSRRFRCVLTTMPGTLLGVRQLEPESRGAYRSVGFSRKARLVESRPKQSLTVSERQVAQSECVPTPQENHAGRGDASKEPTAPSVWRRAAVRSWAPALLF